MLTENKHPPDPTLTCRASSSINGPALPKAIGPGIRAATASGGAVGVVDFGAPFNLCYPQNYVSGTAYTSEATWPGQTFATLGIFPGTYVYTWGAGANADSFTLRILNSQTITFANPGPQLPGANLVVTATASSGLAPVFTTATPAVCTTTAAGIVTLVTVGTCTINANQAGNATTDAAPQVAQSFAIGVPASNAAGVPTLSEWALILLAGGVAALGYCATRRTTA